MTSLACITIDDCLLRRRYGFLDLYKLIDWLREEDLAATLAFIPWNYKRTDRKIAELFRDNANRISICLHGCDHTKGEFDSTDTYYLDGICALAKKRMIEHERLYGIPWDNLMVFPQGKFSAQAMLSLRSAGFLAAVCSVYASCRYEMSCPYVAEFQFPLITRRYPERVNDFVRDAHAGKPILITQHHWDFAGGFESLRKFTRELKSKIPHLQWMPLGRIVDKMGFIAGPATCCAPIRRSAGKLVKIALRRRLCEFRDNFVQPRLKSSFPWR